MNTENPEGIVLEIQRLSTEDGPGIRTTVFLKGCSLKCAWCHNPESIPFLPQIQWIVTNCIGCNICVQTCPVGAIGFHGDELIIDRGLCTGCGKCSGECPSGAIELLGTKWTAEEFVNEVIKDRSYFEKSGGGITLSGGEAILQTNFVYQVARKLWGKGIHTAIDTCGHCPKESFELLLPYIDLVLFDLKEIDPARHEEFTSSSNEKILENLKYIATYVEENHTGPKLWVRTPIIPGATDNEKTIRAIGGFISKNLGRAVERWELCAFNNLCKDKYLRLGLNWAYKESELLKQNALEKLSATAKSSGVDPQIVHWSGSTRMPSKMEEAK